MHLIRLIALVAALLPATLHAASLGQAAPMQYPRVLPRSAMMPDGKIMVLGGYDNSGPVDKVEIYDPGDNTWSQNTPSMTEPRYTPTLTRLKNGTYLVTGGYNGSGASDTTEIFDPATGWSQKASMIQGRYSHTATLLPDGRVLVVGGYDNSWGMGSAEVYDPTLNTWTYAGTMAVTDRFWHTATLIGNDRVLIAGSPTTPVCEVYNFINNTWTNVGSLAGNRYCHTATQLSDGRVMVVGGYDYNTSTTRDTAEIFDPLTGEWSSGGTMSTPRYFATTVSDGNGHIFAMGGYNAGYGIVTSVENYSIANNTWATVDGLDFVAYGSAGHLLANGSLFLAGGMTANGPTEGGFIVALPAPPEDADHDGLTFAQEVVMGYDPSSEDTGNTGVADPFKDKDGDRYSNLYEIRQLGIQAALNPSSYPPPMIGMWRAESELGSSFFDLHQFNNYESPIGYAGYHSHWDVGLDLGEAITDRILFTASKPKLNEKIPFPKNPPVVSLESFSQSLSAQFIESRGNSIGFGTDAEHPRQTHQDSFRQRKLWIQKEPSASSEITLKWRRVQTAEVWKNNDPAVFSLLDEGWVDIVIPAGHNVSKPVELVADYVEDPGPELSWYDVTIRASLTPFVPDIDIDSDNDGTLSRSEAEDSVEGKGNAGKILWVNGDDSDDDGIPDFADGFNLMAEFPNDDHSSGDSFIPVVLEIPESMNPQTTKVRLTYSASPPLGVAIDSSGGSTTWTKPPGRARLWAVPGSQTRDGHPVADQGHFIAPGEYGSLAALGAAPGSRSHTIYLEALTPSETTGDGTILFEVEIGADQWVADEVRYSALDLVPARVTGADTTEDSTTIKDSHPAAEFQNIVVTTSNIRPSADGTQLLADIQITANVRSDICDLIPAPQGVISLVRAEINGAIVSPPDGFPVSQQKASSPQAAFDKPYPFTGGVSITLNGAVVSTGNNWIRLSAADEVAKVGLSGMFEYHFTITAEGPEPVILSATTASAMSGYLGWNYLVSGGQIKNKTESDDTNLYLWRIKGPSEVLAQMYLQSSGKMLHGSDNKYYKQNNDGTASKLLLVTGATIAQHIADTHDPDFHLGFLRGFVLEGRDTVVDTVKLAVKVIEVGNRINHYLVVGLVIKATGGNPLSYEPIYQLKADAESVSKFAKSALDLAMAAHLISQAAGASALETLYHVHNLDPASAYKSSEVFRYFAFVAIDIFIAAQEEFANEPPFNRGEFEGRIGFQILSAIVPATKVGWVSKGAILADLRSRFDAGSRAARVLDRVLLKISKIPNLCSLCFVAGTPIWTDNGLVAIDTVKVGDLVLARDDTSGLQAFKKVKTAITSYSPVLYHLTVEKEVMDCSGFDAVSEILSCSPSHPFYLPERGDFIPAEFLAPGDKLLLADGQEATLRAVAKEHSRNGLPFTTYNIEVEDYHTYFAGESGVLVHNAGPDPCEIAASLARHKHHLGQSRGKALVDAIIETRHLTTEKSVNTMFRNGTHLILRGELPAPLTPSPGEYAGFIRVTDTKKVYTAKGFKTLVDDIGDVTLVHGGQQFYGHHTTPTFIQVRLNALPGPGGQFTDFDDVPVKMLTFAEHSGAGTGLHPKMAAWTTTIGNATVNPLRRLADQSEVFTTKTQLIDELLKFCKANGYDDQARAVRGLAQDKGIPFNQ